MVDERAEAVGERGWDGEPARPARRLRPEVAARLAARSRAGRLEELYSKPISELSPTDLSLMKAAFFRG